MTPPTLARPAHPDASIFERLNVGVLVQGPLGEIHFANRVARDLLGLDADTLAARTSFDPAWTIVTETGEPFEAHRRPIAQVIATRSAVHDVIMGIDRPDRGDRVWLSVHAEPELDDGGIRQILVTLIDVTERRRMEASLRRSERLQSIGRLAGGIAHDFNNLLTIITSTAGVTMESLPLGDPGRADMEDILNAARQAADLTRQLVTFARRAPAVPRPLDVADALDEVRRMVIRLVEPSITLSFHVPHPIHSVYCDPGEFNQVMLNLTINARDAMPRGGRLQVAAANIDLQGDHHEVPAGVWVRVDVIDDGEGMDDVLVRKIFEPFFTTKAAGKGTGLGLAIVHEILQRQNGHVTVHSRPGEGTRFSVWFRALVGIRPAVERIDGA